MTYPFFLSSLIFSFLFLFFFSSFFFSFALFSFSFLSFPFLSSLFSFFRFPFFLFLFSFLSLFLLSFLPFFIFPLPLNLPTAANFADKTDEWGGVTPPHTPPIGTPLSAVIASTKLTQSVRNERPAYENTPLYLRPWSGFWQRFITTASSPWCFHVLKYFGMVTI